jgi:hypothetical protein
MLENICRYVLLGSLLLIAAQGPAKADTTPSTNIAAVDTSAVIDSSNTKLQTAPPLPLYTRYFEINNAPQYSHLTGVNIPNKASGTPFTLAGFSELRFSFYRNSTGFSFPADNALVQTIGNNLTVVVQTSPDGYYHVCADPNVSNNAIGFNDATYATRPLSLATWLPDITSDSTTFLNASTVYAGGDNTNNLNIGRFLIFRTGRGNPDIPSTNFNFRAPSTEIDSSFAFQ